MRNKVCGDILGVRLEVTRSPLLRIPRNVVDKLIILNLRIRRQGFDELAHVALSGSRRPHNTVFRIASDSDDNPGQGYPHNNKVVRVRLEAILKHDAFGSVVDSGR